VASPPGVRPVASDPGPTVRRMPNEPTAVLEARDEVTVTRRPSGRRVEQALREALAGSADVSVEGPPWGGRDDGGTLVVLARGDDARAEAHEVLEHVLGLTEPQWRRHWTSLGERDWMFPVLEWRTSDN
jgi:hypothetical protein